MPCTSYIPSILLLPYIDRYWCGEIEKGVDLFPLFAGTGLDLFIHFGTPFHVEREQLGSSHIFCPRKTLAIASNGKLNFWAVRFRGGAFRHFCPISFNELNNNFLSVPDIWGREGLELVEKLQDEEDSTLKVDFLNAFFLKQLTHYRRESESLDWSISYIYKNYDDVVINSVAKSMHVSLRHFERLFKAEFGVSPKKFQVISRFQSTLKELLLTSSKDYLPIVLKNGYYDQSHFIKECKLLSSLCPLVLLSMNDMKTHFYFKKL